MRIWDINPGYLDDDFLHKEHLDIHHLFTIIKEHKKDFFQNYEEKRWFDYPWALCKRHQLIASEMEMRGINHDSEIIVENIKQKWPHTYIYKPHNQFKLLLEKYKNNKTRRISLPLSAQQLWRQHKYSIMARNISEYKLIGQNLSGSHSKISFSNLSIKLIELMHIQPSKGGLTNALQHMWGYFKNTQNKINVNTLTLDQLLRLVQKLAYQKKEKYILDSTALSDFKIWM